MLVKKLFAQGKRNVLGYVCYNLPRGLYNSKRWASRIIIINV